MSAAAASPSIGPQAQPLTRADLERFLTCGIPESLIARAGIFRVNSDEGARIVGRRPGSGDYSGLAFPYFWPGEDRPCEYRLRRDRPEYEIRPDGKTREKAKYLSPPGARPRLYFVPGTQPGALGDASLPILVTEGEKKTLALQALGDDGADRPRWLPVGIAGVWNWRGTVGTETGPDGSRQPVKGAIKDLDRLQWRGRKVTIIFDTNVRNNPSVQAARWELTRDLRRRGAVVHWWHWPQDTPAGVNGIDDLIGAWGQEAVLERWPECERLAPASLADCEHLFESLGPDHYRLSLPAACLSIDLDRIRWEHTDLLCECVVRCELPGIPTVRGVVAAGKLNLSSLTTRRSFAKELERRAPGLKELPWNHLIEEAALSAIEAERAGAEMRLLDTYPEPSEEDQFYRLHGWTLTASLPTILFAPGGLGKSFLALWAACELARQGVPVCYVDTEADWRTHRLRKAKLYGSTPHNVYYYRARRPLPEEADALRRACAEWGIRYVVVDSISLAGAGPLEESATAISTFQALARIGVGGDMGALLIGHCPKDRDTIFGSVFWANNARLAWHASRVDDGSEGYILKLKADKTNVTPTGQVVCFRITFGERVEIRPVDPSDIEEVAAELPLIDRIEAALRRGAKTSNELAEELDSKPDTIRKTLNRHLKKTGRFTVLSGGRYALREHGAGVGEEARDDD